MTTFKKRVNDAIQRIRKHALIVATVTTAVAGTASANARTTGTNNTSANSTPVWNVETGRMENAATDSSKAETGRMENAATAPAKKDFTVKEAAYIAKHNLSPEETEFFAQLPQYSRNKIVLFDYKLAPKEFQEGLNHTGSPENKVIYAAAVFNNRGTLNYIEVNKYYFLKSSEIGIKIPPMIYTPISAAENYSNRKIGPYTPINELDGFGSDPDSKANIIEEKTNKNENEAKKRINDQMAKVQKKLTCIGLNAEIEQMPR